MRDDVIHINSVNRKLNISSLSNGTLTAYFDAMVEKTFNFEAEVPEYVTESGYKVAESVQRSAYELSVTGYITNMPTTVGKKYGSIRSGDDKVDKTVEILIMLFNSGDKLTFKSNGATYKDVVLKSLNIPKTADMQGALEISLTLKHVRTVGIKAAKISKDVEAIEVAEKQAQADSAEVLNSLLGGDMSALLSLVKTAAEKGYINDEVKNAIDNEING